MRRHRIRGLTSPCTLLRCVVDTSGEDSEISHEERVELYAIEEVAPHAGVRLLAEKNARNLPRFLAHRGVTPFNREAFDRALAAYHAHCDRAGAAYGQLPLWLDSCCGTGRSTLRLAEQNPGAFVIGVDKSGVRLERNAAFRRSGDGAGAPNAVLVRADCCDFWRLLWESGARVQRHTLFYPNPYPKPRDLPRRWHGDPAFPILLRLGGDLEVRASWGTYLHEMASAIAHVAGSPQPEVTAFEPLDAGISNFEAKYKAAGMPLYRLRAPGLPFHPPP